MKNKRLYISLLSFAILLAIFGFSLFIQILPIIIFIVPLFYIRKIIQLFRPHKKNEKLYSESIFQKRLKRFKSIKRGYYSLIVLVVLYVMSLIGPLWMNIAQIVLYFANGKYDEGEEFTDLNKNGKYDEAESFTDAANGKWDVGEELTDVNGNGKYDKVSDKDKELLNCYIESKKNHISITERQFPSLIDY